MAIAKNCNFIENKQLTNYTLTSVNHITKPNWLQHLKVIQISTALYSTVIHVVAKFLLTVALQDFKRIDTCHSIRTAQPTSKKLVWVTENMLSMI